MDGKGGGPGGELITKVSRLAWSPRFGILDLDRKYMESWEGVIVNYSIIKFSVALVKEIERAVTYMSLAKPSGRQKKREQNFCSP